MSKRTEKLAAQLKSLRKARDLTQEQLSKLAGVSKAMLSQIEQNKINPTVAIILKICDALNVSITELLGEAPRENILKVIRDSDEHYTFRKDASCEIRTLSPLNLEKSIEHYRIRLEPGGQLASEAHFAGTEEFLYLASGRLTVTSGSDRAELHKRDSAHYRADVPHCLSNEGKQTAEAFLIVRYPSIPA
ncbi:MAG: helix-turn-helix transcriptional regulator [Sedimentisphaerales bacterium]|nr:helix-turn-helix transcriptional regulator [Sedimentisphaerales bacterium]